jgi:Sulfotransferase domain
MFGTILNAIARRPGHVFVNSVPKAGTHLVMRALELMGMDVDKPHHISAAQAERFTCPEGPQVPVGISTPVLVSLQRLRDMVRAVPANEVLAGHVPHSAGFADLLSELRCRMVLVIRDPRDVVVSLAFHMINVVDNSLYAWAQTVSADERLMAAIRGLPGEAGQPSRLLDVNQRFRSILPFVHHPNAMLVHFEQTIGARGGGDDQEQQHLLRRLSTFAGRKGADLAMVHREIFGNSATFRKGTTGQWKEHLKPEHKAAMKQIAGPLLIELGYASDDAW